jgi:hypothetical protein
MIVVDFAGDPGKINHDHAGGMVPVKNQSSRDHMAQSGGLCGGTV